MSYFGVNLVIVIGNAEVHLGEVHLRVTYKAGLSEWNCCLHHTVFIFLSTTILLEIPIKFSITVCWYRGLGGAFVIRSHRLAYIVIRAKQDTTSLSADKGKSSLV